MIDPGRLLNEARFALMLLTRLPAGRVSEPVPAMRDAVWAYPLAGLAVGLIGAITLSVAYGLGLPSLASALLALAAMALATGAMHEDGLADMADGFGGGQTRERKLEIMRDSRIGTYGVLALVLVVGLRASALSALSQGWSGAFAVIACAAASRGLLPAVMALMPPARDDGLGRSAGSPERSRAANALGLGFVALLVFLPFSPAFAAMAAGAVAALGVSLLAKRQIGGLTGDTLGATQILAETAMLLAVLAALPQA